jgi:hypothetical protein
MVKAASRWLRHFVQDQMKTTELLNFALRARNPMALRRWYAELFEARALCEPEKAEAGPAQLRAELSDLTRNHDSAGGVPGSLIETQMQQQQQQ